MATMTTTTVSANTDEHIVKYELFDPNVMDELLKQTSSFSASDLRKLAVYKRGRMQGNKVEVVYHYGKGCEKYKLGRLYAKDNQGLQAFVFDMRNPLLEKFYWDVDMENAHYNILAKLADSWGLKTDSIRQYINNRDEELKKVSSTRMIAKTAFLKVAYGGHIKMYNEHYNDDGIAPEGDISLLKAIEVEMKNIVEMCWLKHKMYHELVRKKNNREFSLFALILQTEERKCLLAMDEYMKSQGRSVDVYIHDGGEVRKLDGETQFPVALLRGAEEYIREKVGYDLKLVVKPFKHGFVMPNARDEYEEMKIEFEKAHFKLNDPVAYVRVYEKEVKILTRSDLMNLYENMFYNGTESFIKKWLTDPTMRTYEQLVYKPMQEVESKYFNLFQGYNCDAVQGDISVVHEVLNLVCNYEKPVFEYVEKYMAHLLQRPYDKAGVSIIVQSNAEGTGKDSYFDLIGRILGGEYFLNTASAGDSVFSKFNGHWKKALMIKMEELSFMETKAHADKFKSFITAPRISFEDKGQKTITIDNYTRFIGTTNNAVPVVVGTNDRRFVLIRASEKRVGDKDFWDKTQKVLHSDATREAYFHYLMNLDISEFNVRDRPITEYYEEVKESFIPYHAQFFQHKVENMPEDSEISWSASDLVEDMKMSTSSKFELNQTRVGRDLRLYMKDDIVKKKKGKTNNKYIIVCKDMREYLEKKGWWYEL